MILHTAADNLVALLYMLSVIDAELAMSIVQYYEDLDE